MITSIVDMSFKNSYHFITTGSYTLVHLDIRKGVLSTSEEQSDEFLSGCITSDRYSVFGMSEGTVTVWDNSHLDEIQKSGMTLSDQSIDCVIAGAEENEVFAGGADGLVYKLNVHSSKKESIWTHSKKEEVSMLELDSEYRLVTAGMETVKIWRSPADQRQLEEAEEAEQAATSAEKDIENSNDSESQKKNDSDEEDAKPARKKSKKGQGKAKKARKYVHGISSFEGL
ncbi:Jip5p [Sugiyamaella lignohabitans]|uniref:Jip5p n=1 Tax=Sugiyamaella lignohabitans TaxID=796027 RepID=A0A167F8P9_9ASCO|nr:Jip5p [Sugiyamaella lignohabitans]ANB14964.1 Jip5p [Sugiyamaella lignohabitans]